MQDYVNTNKLQYVYELHKLNALIGLWYFIQALVGPLKFFSGTRRVWRCVLASWLLAAIVAIPHVVVSGRTERRSLSPDTTQDTTVYYKCDSSGYTSEWQRTLYFTFLALSLLVIPASIMLFCYASVVRVLWLKAGTEAARNINQPRVHFVTSRRSATVSDQAVSIARFKRSATNDEVHTRCRLVLQNSHLAVGMTFCLSIIYHLFTIIYILYALYAKGSDFSEPVLQHLVNVYCKPYLLYGADVIEWNSSDLSSISHAFNSAMCKIYKVKFQLLDCIL